jgi:Fe-S cluster biogenesis protein NfuA/nitrite reductase/ring-hydroxylating ferredoxin subunit
VPALASEPGPVAEEALVGRVTALTEELGALPDPRARELGEELAAAVVQLYGAGIDRLVAALDAAELARLARDDGLVASLLLIHGLHPVGLRERVEAALDGVRPYLESHGGDVALLDVDGGVARLRLSGSCEGCSASQATLELAIEGALEEAAPDLFGLEVEGVVAPPPRPSDELDGDVAWVELDGVADLARGTLAGVGDGLLVANVAGTLLAYHDACAGCEEPLTAGTLVGGRLTCARCGVTFDLPRAGRCVGDGDLQLRPIPLLRNGGPVRVALAR